MSVIQLKRKHVLVIASQKTYQTVFREIIGKSKHYQIHTFNDSTEASAWLNNRSEPETELQEISMIIYDYNRKEGEEIQAIKRIKALPACVLAPLVVSALEDDRETLLSNHLTGLQNLKILFKPYPYPLLKEKVHGWLNNS